MIVNSSQGGGSKDTWVLAEPDWLDNGRRGVGGTGADGNGGWIR